MQDEAARMLTIVMVLLEACSAKIVAQTASGDLREAERFLAGTRIGCRGLHTYAFSTHAS
jgi:hypothetical protein